MVLRQSEIEGEMHTIKMPDSATNGLNTLLGLMEKDGADVGVLTHQDMHYRQGWLPQLRDQLNKLPESWVVAGIIGKDLQGRWCGQFQDMRAPLKFNSLSIHDFPQEASCFDECCLIVNLKKGFRFDERLQGFDLYGSLCVAQAEKMGGTAWVLDCFAEHYCMRPFSWQPDQQFIDNFKWIHDEYPGTRRIDTTVVGSQEREG